MKVIQYENIAPDRWDMACRDMAAPIYFDSRWSHVFKRAYGIRTIYCTMEHQHNILAVLPLSHISGPFGNNFISLPFVYAAGMMGEGIHWQSLLSHCKALIAGTRNCHLVLRQNEPIGFDSGLYLDEENVHYVLQLATDEKTTFDRLKRSGRKQVKKSLSHGFYSRSGKDELSSFYSIYIRRMNELGTPCHSRKFWKSILDAFPDEAGVLTVYDGAKAVAGMIYLQTENVFHDVLAVSLSAYRQQCAYYFLHWEAVRMALKNGIDRFDFERSQKNTGTAWFKRQWGGEEMPLYYYSSNKQSLSGTKLKYRRLIGIWKQFPVSVTRMISPFIRRYIP